MGAFSVVAAFGLSVFLASPPTLENSEPLAGLTLRLTHIQPGARILKAGDHQGVALITGLSYEASGATAREKAENFLAAFPEFTRHMNLRYARTSRGRTQTTVHLEQWHDGRPVFDRTATITLGQDGRIRSFNSDAAPVHTTHRAKISSTEARNLARSHLQIDAKTQFPLADNATVKSGVVVMAGTATEVFEVHMARAPLAEHLVVRVDAHRGQVIGVRNLVIHE